MARKSDISDGVALPITLCKNPGVACSEISSSSHAGSVENEKEDLIIVEAGTENRDTPVGLPSRGKMSVFQSKKPTLEAASEGTVRKKCSDDDITVIKHIITPPKISLSAAKKIKREVKKLCQERYKQQCAESSEGLYTLNRVDSSPTRLPGLSSYNSITAKTGVGQEIQSEGQRRDENTGMSDNIYRNAVLSNNTTVLSTKEDSTRSEVLKVRDKPKVVLNTVRAVIDNSSIALKNTAQDILFISLKNNTSTSTTIRGSPAMSPCRRSKSTLPSADCEVSESKIMSTEDKKTGNSSVTNKNLMAITTASGPVAVLPSGALKVPVERVPSENFTVSETSSCMRRQCAFPSGHKISLPRPMPLQKKNSNKSIIPEQADSDMKRQHGLFSEHSVVSPSQMCASVLAGGSTLENGEATDSEAPNPPGAKVESVVNKLHHYIKVLCSDIESKESDPSHQSLDKEQDVDFTSTGINTLVQNKKVVSETGCGQSCSISVVCRESTSSTLKQIASGSPLCSASESKVKEIAMSPEMKRKKILDFAAGKSTESILPKLEVPVSSSGNSVTCVASTDKTYKQRNTVLCNTAGEDFVEAAVTTSELDITHPQSQNFKLSHEISQHPRKYSLIKSNSFEILMAGHKTPQKKSPSKKLSKSSPIKYLRNNRSPCKWMVKSIAANRALKFDNCDTKNKSESLALTQLKSQSQEAELSFKKECVSYFEFIIAEVLRDKDMLSILSEEDVNVVINFRKLEYQVKKLYIRMLSRKYTWHRVSNIKYDDIVVPAAFTELEISGLITSDCSCEELEVLLNMLKLTELKALCQTFRIQPVTQPKTKLIQALLKYGRSQQTISGNHGGDSMAIIKSRLTETLGHCIKLCEKGRESFCRIVRLFSLHHQGDEEDRETSKQLILLHYVKTRKVKFPTYAVLKSRPIFSSRDDLMRFEEASGLLTGLMNALSTKQWDKAKFYGECVREHFRTLLEDSVVNEQVKSLPLFIRRYTAGSVCAYAMTKAVEAYKKHKDQLPECVVILQELLCQDVYLPHYQGKWYEELALILEVHLKHYAQAAATVIEALKDDHLNEIHQQMLSTRGFHLSRKKQIGENLTSRLKDCLKEPLEEPPSVVIKAKSLQINAPGRKQVYIQENASKQEITYSSVEECAISHYKSEGYIEGMHDEGSAIRSLFGLIFWDVIYEHPVPDVFRSSYQQEPLDLRSGEFYRNRKEGIDKRLENLCGWDMKYVQYHVEKIFKENEGKESVVNWQRFRNLPQIVGLINCIGVQVLSKILERLVKNYRAVCSGFPDLLVWNPYSSKYKFVEVKGPRDRLSAAQKMWLNYLTKCNANAEVCYVKTTGANKQKLKMGNLHD